MNSIVITGKKFCEKNFLSFSIVMKLVDLTMLELSYYCVCYIRGIYYMFGKCHYDQIMLCAIY